MHLRLAHLRLTQPHRLFAASLLTLALCLANAAQSAAAAYQPSLRKVSPTRSILIVDLAKEHAEGTNGSLQYETLEAYLAIRAIQGIVNRDSDEKVYLLNSPSGYFEQGGGWHAPPLDQWALDEGMLPVPRTLATLDTAKRWPALSYLARRLGAVRTFDEVDVTWQTAPTHGDALLVSGDGAHWTPLAVDAGECPLPATHARYLRVDFTGPATLAQLRVVQVDRTALVEALDRYATVLKQAVVGSAPGQYPQAAVDAFEAVVRNARAVLATPVVTQRALDHAEEQAGCACQAFLSVRNSSAQPLQEALRHADELVKLATPHTGAGLDAFPADALSYLAETLRKVSAQCTDPLPVAHGLKLLAQLHDAEQYLLTSSPTPTPPDSPANLAYRRPVQCGGTSDAFTPKAAVDGSLSTLWKSASDKQENWFSIDLGTRHTVSVVRVIWGNTYATHYHLDVSDDGAAWHTVHTTTTGGGDTETILLPPTPARFVRLSLQAWPWGNDYQIREIVVSEGAIT